jgi:proline iminopeptidase
MANATMTETQMRIRKKTGKVLVPGGELAYTYFDTPESQDNVPLIVIHGGPAISHHYLLDLSLLATNRPIIFYDQLGCGQSVCSDDNMLWTMPGFAERLEALRASLNINKMQLFGHSVGAAIAIEYTLAYPNHTDRLILASPFLSAALHTQEATTLLDLMPKAQRACILDAEKAQQLDHPDYQAAKKSYSQQFVCRLDPWPENLVASLTSANTTLIEKLLGKSPRMITGVFKDYDIIDKLLNLTMPTLITCGEFDFPRPRSLRSLVPLRSNFIVKEYTNCSHMPHLENSTVYLEDLKTFISN